MADKTRKPYILNQERVIEDVYWTLSNVKRAMDIDQLHEAVAGIIADEGLPIHLEFLDATWRSDPDETRKRIMVSLRDHLWRNIRILIGLDYMGDRKSWLQIQMMLVDDPYFTKILMPKKTGVLWAILSIPALVFGALYPMPEALIGIAAGLGLLGWYARTKQKAFAVNRERQSQIKKFIKEIDMKSNRTFKDDDVRLFTGAMNKVIRMSIDHYMNDDVEIVRTVGKGGGFGGIQ